MAGETQITVIGNLTADPELRYTAQSVPVASFTVASTPRTYNRASGQWEDGTAMFLRCSAWREMAENIAESLTKGMRVIVHGRLQQRNWERDGQNRSSIEIQVDEIGPSLRYAQAQVTRIPRSGAGGFNQGGQGGFNPGSPAGNFNQGGGFNQGGAANLGTGSMAAAQPAADDNPWAAPATSDNDGDNEPPF
ncbi:single-stranded DNA-binding protein [uncultured Varibaculum sp.]|uniref:single-stranded DNA-binding protein n=1 Tax=uncultured Varibaculum sp. TaxID=413896 RepID=UPI002586FE76|nr:single-stranded DNA-binding protein [uncultured Varibaculum sp.]